MASSLLLSLGSVNADFQLRVDQVPEPGRTQSGKDFTRLAGGKAANVAIVARRFGIHARLLARVGGDPALREQALGPLRTAGVDLSGVTVAEGCETGVSLIAVLPDGEKIILLAGNANGAWSEAAADAATAAVVEAPPGSVLVTDAEVPAEVVACCIEAARRRRLPVVLDPSPAGQVAKKLLVGVAAITPNPREAEALTGIAVDGFDAAHQAAIILRTLGVPLACVKLGGGGCVAAWEGGVVGVPRVPVPTVDSTGAGDAFAGALGVALLEGRPPREAACLAVATAGLAVTAWGSQPAYPSRADAERLMPGLLAATHDLLAV